MEEDRESGGRGTYTSLPPYEARTVRLYQGEIMRNPIFFRMAIFPPKKVGNFSRCRVRAKGGWRGKVWSLPGISNVIQPSHPQLITRETPARDQKKLIFALLHFFALKISLGSSPRCTERVGSEKEEGCDSYPSARTRAPPGFAQLERPAGQTLGTKL